MTRLVHQQPLKEPTPEYPPLLATESTVPYSPTEPTDPADPADPAYDGNVYSNSSVGLESSLPTDPPQVIYSVFIPPPDVRPITEAALAIAAAGASGYTTDKEFDEIVQSAVLSNDDHKTSPHRIAEGSSGSYFICNAKADRIAVFKPQDEEPYGPLSPKMAKWLQRRLCPCFFGRACLINNTGYISEAMASTLDRQLQSYLVPYTGAVSLYSPAFYYPFFYTGKRSPKIGSFQLFLQGYQCSDEFFREYPLPDDRKIVTIEARRRGNEFWTDDLIAQLRHEVEKLVILDFIMRNTDRSFDNWMIKVEDGKLRIGAIDNGLAFPWEHPSEWRSYPYSWLYLPLSIIGNPFSEEARSHYLPLLTSSFWWHDTVLKLREVASRDAHFRRSGFRKQIEVLKGQAWCVLETLKADGEGPLDLIQKPRMLVIDQQVPARSTSSVVGSNPGQLGQLWYKFLDGEIDEENYERQRRYSHNDYGSIESSNRTGCQLGANRGSAVLPATASPSSAVNRYAIIEQLHVVETRAPVFTWC